MAESIFVVLGLDAKPELATTIEAELPGKFLQVRPDTWLVTASGTSGDLSDRLKITDGPNGTGLVLNISGYSGWAPLNIWEWLKATRIAVPNG